MQKEQDNRSLLHQILEIYWGYKQFRDLQEETIVSVLQGKDTLLLMPTGGGKSMCYQLPAIITEGVCIVISPLLALMKDQTISLYRKNIPAAYISAEMEDSRIDDIYKKCKDGRIKILFISPERLLNANFLYNIQEIQVSFIAVDEAHCISEWGQDFRPSYQNIKRFRENFPHIPCLALTATATPKVVDEITTKLGLKQVQIFKKSYKRDNLSINILDVMDKYDFVYQFMLQKQGSGLIYIRTRKEAQDLANFLIQKKIPHVDYYHAGLSSSDKNKKQREWLSSNTNTIICTNAFGMGIDKDSVQFVLHLSPPQSIENYYQEIGRAGRNGTEAQTILLWNTPELESIDSIIASQTLTKKEFAKIVRTLYSFFQIADYEYNTKTNYLSVSNIEKITKISKRKISSVLNFLHNQEIIYYNTTKSSSAIQLLISPDEIELLGSRNSYFLELLLRNIPGVAHYKVHFNESKFCEKTQIHLSDFHDKINELTKLEYIDYIDGQRDRINFLVAREDSIVETKMWNLFLQIQRNKIQKWEEMKFFIQNHEYCKMKLILSYFGEKDNISKCKKCSVCKKYEWNTDQTLSAKIIENLSIKPMGIDELAIRLVHFDKEIILDTVIELREMGVVTMYDFKTYKLV